MFVCRGASERGTWRDAQAIVAALGAVNDGDVLVLILTGELLDGTPIEGQDVVWIKQKSK